MGKEKRRSARRISTFICNITYTDASGVRKPLIAYGCDISHSGLRAMCSETVPPGTAVGIHVQEFGVLGVGIVKHCSRRGSHYSLGIEFQEDARNTVHLPRQVIDYYEVLQISPRAEIETIHRVYRLMAARYHPDNKETGNAETFLLLSQAHATLCDPQTRAAYDATREISAQKALPVFQMKEFLDADSGEENRRIGVLCLLYNRRRVSPENPAFSLLELEVLMAFPREHLCFTIWYLKEKGFIRVDENSGYVVTVAGIDHLESKSATNRLAAMLLKPSGVKAYPEAENPDPSPPVAVQAAEPVDRARTPGLPGSLPV